MYMHAVAPRTMPHLANERYTARTGHRCRHHGHPPSPLPSPSTEYLLPHPRSRPPPPPAGTTATRARTRAPGAPRAPHAVDVVGGGAREVVVDHRGHARKVHAAPDQVGGHQHPRAPKAEVVDRGRSGRAALVGVDAVDVHAVEHQLSAPMAVGGGEAVVGGGSSGWQRREPNQKPSSI